MSAVLPPTNPTTLPVAVSSPTRLSSTLPAPLRGEERLNLSRERMRLHLETARGGRQSTRLTDRALRSGWLASLRDHPAVSASLDTLSAWWSRHPLRFVAVLAEGALKPTIDARARKRPMAAMSLAVLAGAVAVWMRPWRWLFRPALFVGLLTQVAKRVLTEVPLESMVKIIGAYSGAPSVTRRSENRQSTVGTRSSK